MQTFLTSGTYSFSLIRTVKTSKFVFSSLCCGEWQLPVSAMNFPLFVNQQSLRIIKPFCGWLFIDRVCFRLAWQFTVESMSIHSNHPVFPRVFICCKTSTLTEVSRSGCNTTDGLFKTDCRRSSIIAVVKRPLCSGSRFINSPLHSRKEVVFGLCCPNATLGFLFNLWAACKHLVCTRTRWLQ